MTTNNSWNSQSPAQVAMGGTGVATQAAYSLVAGGTTATGAFQAISPPASISSVMMSTGASSLPAFTTTGTPLVNSLTFNGAHQVTCSTFDSNTFTPGVTFGGGNTGITYTTQTGKYYRLGPLVFYSVYVLLSSKGSSTGYLSITGLPFTSASDTVTMATCPGEFWGASFPSGANYSYIIGQIPPGGTVINVYDNGPAYFSNVTDANCVNTSVFSFSGFYWTA